MDACPAVFKRGGYNFRLPPLKVRDLRLELVKNSYFSFRHYLQPLDLANTWRCEYNGVSWA